MENIEQQTNKRSKLLIIILATFVLVAVIGFGAMWYLFKEVTTVKQTVAENAGASRVAEETYELGDLRSPRLAGTILSVANDTITVEVKIAVPNPNPVPGEPSFSPGTKNISVILQPDTVYTPSRDVLSMGKMVNVFTEEVDPLNKAKVTAKLISLFELPDQKLIKSLDAYVSSTVSSLKNKESNLK